MDRRIKQGAGRPELDVFGSRYTHAASLFHIGDGYHVAIPSFANRNDVAHAVHEIRAWIDSQIEDEEPDIESSIEDDSDDTHSI